MPSRIEEETKKAIQEKVFPGAALLVSHGEKIVFRNFFGSATEKTIFDIASLTKPLATTTLSLVTVHEKGLSLNAPISRYLKEFEQEDKSKITIRHLLKHTSGLPAWKPYFEEILREHPESVGLRLSQPYYLKKISEEILETPIAYHRNYSDLGFIVLGILLENIWGKPLDQLFQEKIAGPLGMKDTFYISVGAGLPRPSHEFAPTEDSLWRKKLIQGEVHDDNAYTLGGVAGHAGLFSTVDDIHQFVLALKKGLKEQDHVFIQTQLLEFWDTPSPENSQAGRYFSKNTIGHLGYTGCSLWIDLDQDFHVTLLTNRVHPSSKNEAIKKFRPMIHDVIFEELIKETK